MKNIIWFTGNTGAGKTTYARKYIKQFPKAKAILLDGDEMRGVWPGLNLSKESREEQNLRVARLAQLLANQGFLVLVAVICPYRELRKRVKQLCDCDFVYVTGGAPNTEKTPYHAPHNREIAQKLRGNHDY